MSKFIGSFDPGLLQDAGEFSQRYLGGYLFVTTPDKKLNDFVQVTDVRGDTVYYRHDALGRFTANFLSEIEFKLVQLEAGLFEYTNEQGITVTYYGCRIPERQWVRAPSTNNCWFTPMPFNVVEVNAKYSIGYAHLLLPALRKQYTRRSILQAVNELNEKCVSLTVNQEWCVSHSTDHKDQNPILYYRTIPVGTVDATNKKIRIKNTLLYQEVLDYLKYSQEAIDWEVR